MYLEVEGALRLATVVLALVLLAWAFFHALGQRPDKFAALGGLQKHHWLLILGGLLLFSFLGFVGLIIFVYVGIGAAAYYLLETRRGLKDVSEGHW
jgi:amino acid transporter